ncbi:hypothetical protein HMI49_37300 [Corallococcus exercitus]|uniref:Uncharacterized protein n=1 Tax=Corallococcus exercitus TaxID=2316736 RepID=A0A7Y4NVP6_9BACT|nr:hypothetical protein [Corallococcus exercitus]NOK38859.1 hypothetical protein [Corallococcus exercitus]
MGADVVGFRGCALQNELGEAGFLRKLKLKAYKDAADAAVPPERKPKLKLNIRIGDTPPVSMAYPDLEQEAEAFTRRVSGCEDCPITEGAPVGCYAYVSYPIDAPAEELLFEVVVRGLESPGSVGHRFHQEIMGRFEPPPAEWVERRGEAQGALCVLEHPLEHSWHEGGEVRRLTSADVLWALFATLDDARGISLVAELLSEVGRVARERQAAATGTLPELVRMGDLARALSTVPGGRLVIVD